VYCNVMINHNIDRSFEKSSSKDKFRKIDIMAVTTALQKNRFEKKFPIKKKLYIKVLILKIL
jgi:hypothetical protein